MFFILKEAKQSLINLGIPEVIATIFYEKFGKNAYTIARWYKEYTAYRNDYKNWWREVSHGISRTGIVEMVDLYNAMKDFANDKITVDQYNSIREKLGFAKDDGTEELSFRLEQLKDRIEEDFLQEVFFGRNLIKDILSGKIKSIQPYSKLSFDQANQKYEEKSIFKDKKPLKTYSNGWRWVDAGQKCDLVGKQMKNCGSTGLMSMDQNRTMLTLFDPNNIPHVVATYSPGEKRLSGVEGQASTGVKNEYADYVVDLAKTLGAELDLSNNKSTFLKLKWMLNPASIQEVEGRTQFSSDNFYIVRLQNGEEYYTNGYEAVLKDKVDNIPQPELTLFKKLSYIFDYYNKNSVIKANPDVRYINIHKLAQTQVVTEAIRKIIKETVRASLKSYLTRN